MRVGGPAQFWAEPETEEAFARLVRFCTLNEIPLFVMGRGSNLLVRDGGIRGVVVHLARGEFKKVEVREGKIIAGVGREAEGTGLRGARRADRRLRVAGRHPRQRRRRACA